MRSGRLDRRVIIKAKTISTNSFGEEVEMWNDLDTVWAERLELRGAEKWTAQQVVGGFTCRYRIRFRLNVTELNTLLDVKDNQEYDINSVIPIGRNKGLELTCSRKVN